MNTSTTSPAPDAGSHPPAPAAAWWEKLALFVALLVLSVTLLKLTYRTIERFNNGAVAESTIAWELPERASIKPGPANFHYDAESRRLLHRGPMDARQLLALRDLLEFDTGKGATATPAATAAPARGAASASGNAEPTASQVQAALKSYHAALDALAYRSNARQVGQIQLLLLLGLLGGCLGAILRSLVDFVGNACYKDALDLRRWWPLYATRPLVGATLGFLLVVLFKAKLLTSLETQTGDDSFWWLGVAAIGGFSTVDVTMRLRLAAKALFGVESKDASKSGKGDAGA
ncbi:hypothetical protein ACS5PK_04495 [Roseateles sp. DB2]|uniref:hypothetical protein n=1 Tax=Roseateles sp. DB2 TaxID=3453717 RepID=UPI003EEF9C1A